MDLCNYAILQLVKASRPDLVGFLKEVKETILPLSKTPKVLRGGGSTLTSAIGEQ